MALTKAVASIQDWTAVAQAAIGESAAYNCAPNYETALQIQAFLDTTTAHVGSEFIVQVSSNTSGDEDWSDLVRFTELVNATPITITITNNPATVGTVTWTSGTVAAGWAVADLVSRWVGIKDLAALADSELLIQTGYTLNTSIVTQDGSTVAHAINTTIHSTAFSRDVQIPIWANRVRVLVNNNYDNNGSTLNYKVRAYSVTAL